MCVVCPCPMAFSSYLNCAILIIRSKSYIRELLLLALKLLKYVNGSFWFSKQVADTHAACFSNYYYFLIMSKNKRIISISIMKNNIDSENHLLSDRKLWMLLLAETIIDKQRTMLRLCFSIQFLPVKAKYASILELVLITKHRWQQNNWKAAYKYFPALK